MKLFSRIVLIAAIASASLLGACTPEERAANEAKVKAVISAIKNGAAVANAALNDAMNAVCTNTGAVNASVMVVRAGLSTQSGPNTTQNLANLDKAVAAVNAACARIAANPNDPALKSLLLTAWNEYQIAKLNAQAVGGG